MNPMYAESAGSGYPVLFIHGVPTSGRLWNPVVDRMRDRFRCITIDLPGLGRSAGIPGRLGDLEALSTRIEELRRKLDVNQWHVVGHDAGAAIALHYAHKYPERLDRLALLSPAIFPDLKPFCIFQILRTPMLGEALAPVVNQVFWKVAMRRSVMGRLPQARQIIEDFHAPFAGFSGGWRLMSLSRWGDPAAVLASLPGLLPHILAPTLIFRALQDAAVPEQFARRASAFIPNSRLVTVDAGHFLPLDEPLRLASELLQFFASAAPLVRACANENTATAASATA